MLNNVAWETVSQKLIADDFYRASHRIIYRSMVDLDARNQPLDVITLSEHLENKGELDSVGGMAVISALMESTPTALNINAYADIVRDKSATRGLIAVANIIAESGFNPQGRSSTELINAAEEQVFKISDARRLDVGPQALNPLLDEAIERIEKLRESKGAITGISTGFEDIDKMTSGLQRSELIIVAGRPSMGKTALMMNMAESAALNDKNTDPVLIFSLEMSAPSLVLRMLSSMGRINQYKIRTGQLSRDDDANLTSAQATLIKAPIFIDDSSMLTPTDIRSRARRLVRECGPLKMIVVDYLQLMHIQGTSENRTGEVSEISRSLKAIAKDFHCPLVAGSQFNRGPENRPDRRPAMADLRESGAIEQDADLIIGLYRESVHNKDADPRLSEAIIMKQRNGPTGIQKLTFFGEFTRFDNYADEYQM